MTNHYTHLGVFSDLVSAANRSHPVAPDASPGPVAREAAMRALAFEPGPAEPRDVRIDGRWERDGVEGECLSWSVGFGPRTEAWCLRPAGMTEPLPGVVALHDHGAFKYYGKEKIAIGPDEPTQVQQGWLERLYGGKAFANELAKRGYVVLVPDCYTWGSRGMPYDTIPEADRSVGEAMHAQQPMAYNPPHVMPEEMSRYCWAAIFHEHTVQKYCHALGTSMAGIIAHEDRVAATYLMSREDVTPGGVGCIGLSGGGLRAGLMQATCEDVRASVVVGLMSTYAGVLDHNIASHTWMFYPSPELTRQMDWPDMVACRAPSPLMVQYDREDELFTMEGMQAAHERLTARYCEADADDNYVGKFYPGPHKFDQPMQADAFDWLDQQLASPSEAST